MSKRILIESSLTERIEIKNKKRLNKITPISGINYFDYNSNAYTYENEANNINLKYNNEIFNSFTNSILRNNSLIPEVIFTNKTVDKHIIFESGEEKYQRIFYNEISLALSTYKQPNKKLFSGFGFTNKLITEEEMQLLYESLMRQVTDHNYCVEIADGKYDIILSPEVAGIFIHEIIGHMCEYDNTSSVIQSFKDSVIENFTVIDDPTIPNLWGSYKFDDEGVLGKKTILFEKGTFKNHLHNQASSKITGTIPNGHARLLNYKFKPIIRMSNTYLSNGDISFDEMISTISHGIVALTGFGGVLKRDVFKLNVLSGIIIENGKLTKKTGPFSIWGKVGDALKKICAIGDVSSICSGQGCYKMGQGPLPVTVRSPHIQIKNLLVTKV